ncbi:MAG: glycosyltransferase family 4 protein [Bacteroidota bacterium]
MRILQLCHKPPLPAVDGGCIAINNFSESILQLGHELKIVTLSTDKHPFLENVIPLSYRQKTQIEAVYVDTRINLVDAFSSIITQDNYNVSRFFSVDLDIRLKNILRKKNFDIVQLESLFMTPYIATIRRASKAKIILRSHNLEYNIWQRLAQQEVSKPKKMYLKYLAKQLKAYEIDQMNEVDGVISISSTDRDKYLQMGCLKPIVSVPTAIDTTRYEPRESISHQPTIFHIGAMDWAPNKEGIKWFLEEVWPIVLAKHPKARLVLAGKELDFVKTEFGGKHKHVQFVGEVENAIDFMRSNDIMIVPLLSGGGIRIKILEGMALGKTVVSTKIGAEGINGKSGEHFLLSNDATEFANNLLLALTEPLICQEIGEHARKFIQEHFSFEVLNRKADQFYNKITAE